MLYKYNCFASFHLLIGAGSKQVGLQELVNLMQEEWMMQKLMSSVSNLGCAAGNQGNTLKAKDKHLHENSTNSEGASLSPRVAPFTRSQSAPAANAPKQY